MAGDGNFLAEMLQAGKSPGVDVIGNLNRGMEFGQNIQNIPLQNMYRQQEMQKMEKQKQVDAAIKQYGLTGDIKGLQAIDPEKAAQVDKASEYFKSQPPESIKSMMRVADQFSRIGPMVNQGNWADVRKRTMAANPALPTDALPPENATSDQIYKFVNAVPLFQAALKAAGQPGKIAGGYYMPPGGGAPQELPPTAKDKSVIAKNAADIAQKRALIGKYGADVQLKVAELGIKQARLDFDKTKPAKGGTYNEATAYDKAVTAADKALSDDTVVREAANNKLATQDPEWSKRTQEEKSAARQKIMPQVREELKKHLIDSYMNERRQKAGVGRPAKSGGKGTTPEQLPVGKAMKVGNEVVGRFPDGLFKIDANGQKLGPYKASIGGGGVTTEDEEED